MDYTLEIMNLFGERSKQFGKIIDYNKWRNGETGALKGRAPEQLAREALQTWKDLQAAASKPHTQLDANQLHRIIEYNHETVLQEHNRQFMQNLSEQDAVAFAELITINLDDAKESKKIYGEKKSNIGHTLDTIHLYDERSEQFGKIIDYNKWRNGETGALKGRSLQQLAREALQAWKDIQATSN